VAQLILIIFTGFVFGCGFIIGGKVGSMETERNLCRASSAIELEFICDRWRNEK
jgi:hypothetical protein